MHTKAGVACGTLFLLFPLIALGQNDALKQWLERQPPETRKRLMEGYQVMARDQEAVAKYSADRLEEIAISINELRSNPAKNAPHWVLHAQSSRLESRRDRGGATFREAGKTLLEDVADSLSEGIVTELGIAFAREAQTEALTISKSVKDARDAEKEGKIVSPILIGVDLLKGTELDLAYSVLTNGARMVKGGGEYVYFDREARRLRPALHEQLDHETRLALLVREREHLRNLVADHNSVARHYERIAEDLRLGKTPSSLPLPPTLQQILWPSAVNPKYTRYREPPPPGVRHDQEPGGIKFNMKEPESALVRLDIDALCYDRDSGNFVLVGGRSNSSVLLDSDALASALLLAAVDGEPWFSLDPVNHADFDTASTGAMDLLRSRFGGRAIAQRAGLLAREGRAAVLKTGPSTRLVSVTVAEFDPELDLQLSREFDVSQELRYSHEFLRYTEGGRILYEADLALKRAVHGLVLQGTRLSARTPFAEERPPCAHAGRGDFAPMIESRRGDGFASVSDVTIELELAVRRRGQAEDDKAASAACPGCRRATEVFNRNVGGLRDQILQDSYPLTRLREFFKAYFAAKILIQKEPGLRQRILRSVQVPVTDCLPERFIPSLVITVNACDQLVDGACPHSDHEWSCGLPFGGGISFQKELKPVELNSPLADPVLAPVAPLIQAVAQNGDAMVVRGNRVVMRVALEPATHLAPLAQIDLEEPIVIPADSKPGLETALRRRGDRDYLLLCVSCVLPAFFLAGSFRSRALFTNKGTLAFLTLLVALFMAVAAIFGESAGLAPALLALCAFAAGGLLLFRPRWAIPPCALLHASIACAALFAVLGKPISAGSIPWSAASLAALAALGLLAWRPSGTAASDVCFHCRRVDRGSLLLSVALLASLSGVFLFVVAAVSFEAADYTSAPLGGPVATSVLYAVLVGALFSAPAFALRRVLVQDAQLVPAALAFAALAVATATPIAVGPPSWRRSLLDRVGGTVIDFSRLDAAVGVALKAGAVFSFIYLAWGVWRVRHVKSSS